MNNLYLIEKMRKGESILDNPIIKKVEAVPNDENSPTKKYKDENGDIQYAYVNRCFCYETESAARDKIVELVNENIDEEKRKLIEALERLDKKKKNILDSIEVVEIISILPFEKELNDNGFYIVRNDDNYELQLKDKSIVANITCDSIDELKEELIKDMKHHLQMIEIEDEQYFNDCDAEYLKTEWKDLVEKILNILGNDD